MSSASRARPSGVPSQAGNWSFIAFGWLYMRKYQQKLVTTYMPHTAHRFFDRTSLPHGIRTGPTVSARPALMRANSPAFTCPAAGLLRNTK